MQCINKHVFLVTSSQLQQQLLFYIVKCHDKGSIQPVGEYKLRNTNKGKISFFITISLDRISGNFEPQLDISSKEANSIISTEFRFDTPEVNFNTCLQKPNEQVII